MVAKMKKFIFLAFHKDYEQFLIELRNLGMIHIVEQDRTELDEEELYPYTSKLKQLEGAVKTLKRYRDNDNEDSFNEPDIELGQRIPEEIEKIENFKSSLNQQLQVSIKESNLLKPWGNFDPENIKKLERAGYRINFFIAPDNQYDKEWETLYDAVVINKESSRTYFVTVTKNNNMAELLNIEEVKMPDVSLESLNKLIESIKEKIRHQDEALENMSDDLPSVKAAIKKLEDEIVFTKAIQSSTPVADNKIILLQGWAPEDNVKEITGYLAKESVYFETSDPLPGDDVPIKFKNNRFSRMFEPIAELYMMPKYNEVDLTPFFAPFYMIFFGLALGDIGYGAFLFILGTLIKILKKDKIEKSLKGIMTLVQILGASTMVCGLLTGGFFGYNIYDINTPFFRNMKDQIFFDNSQMFILSLVLGIIQIMFGMVMKCINRIKQFGFPYAVSTIGWFTLLLSIIVAYLFPKFLQMGGTAHNIVMISSAIPIIFFNSPGKNIFVNIGLSLWDTYNMATGLLGDVLSYVRLFALGLSGGILASVFTSLATGMSPDKAILGPVVTVLIFVIGHAITIFMNALGAFVHPLRLTFVEFYNNSEFTGGGKKYNPFKN